MAISKDLLMIFSDGMMSLAKGMEEMAGKIAALASTLSTEPGISESTTIPRSEEPKWAPEKKETPADTVLNLIRRSRKGIDIYALKQETGFDDKKIYNIIYRLKKEGKIKIIRKGVYVKA